MVTIDVGGTKIVVLKGDITEQEVDVIINAANPSLLGGGGVDGAIHRAAGEQLLEECKQIRKKLNRPLEHGEAVITAGYKLPAKYVIHTPGPIWAGGDKGEDKILAKSYSNSLQLASENNCKTIAFPSISTGAYGYPLKEAAKVAITTVINKIKEISTIKEVRFVLFDDKTYQAYAQALKETITST